MNNDLLTSLLTSIPKYQNGGKVLPQQFPNLSPNAPFIDIYNPNNKRTDINDEMSIYLDELTHKIMEGETPDFLKWLGVDIPADTEEYLNEDDQIMTKRSMEIAINVLNETLKFLNENKIVVPIGLNVEHIMSYNFQASIEMLQELACIYREFCIKTDIY